MRNSESLLKSGRLILKGLPTLFINEKEQIKNWHESLTKKKPASCKDKKDKSPKVKVTLGFYDENETKPYALDKDIVAGKSHYFISGTTGACKSFWLIGFILYLIFLFSLVHDRLSIIIIDLKGELIELLTTKILPAFLINLSHHEQEKIFLNYRHLNPFNERLLFPFNILKSDSNVEQFSSHLPKVISVNTHLQFIFKQSLEEAKKLALLLPANGKRLDEQAILWGKRKEEIYLSEPEERKLLLKELATLPTRHFYFFNRHKNEGLVHLIAPKVQMPDKVDLELSQSLLTNPWAMKVLKEAAENIKEQGINNEPEKIIGEHISGKKNKGINLW